MLNFLRKSLSLEIENFTSLLKVGSNSKFTKSAFVQARKKVRPEVFDELSQVLLNEFYTDNDLALNYLNNCKSNDLIIYDRGYPS